MTARSSAVAVEWFACGIAVRSAMLRRSRFLYVHQLISAPGNPVAIVSNTLFLQRKTVP